MKAKHIIIGVAVSAAVIAVIVMIRRKKAKAQEEGGEIISPGATTTGGSATPPPNVPPPPAASAKPIYAHVKDGAKGKHVITVKTADSEAVSVKIGDSVKVSSPKLTGTYKVWHVYKGSTGYNNLYLDVNFVDGNTQPGMWFKA